MKKRTGMKKWIIPLTVLVILLVSCFSFYHALSRATDNKTAERGIDRREFNQLKEKSKKVRAEFLMRDTAGKKYLVQLIPVEEKVYQEEENWYGGLEGETVYYGDYRLVIKNKYGWTLDSKQISGFSINPYNNQLFVLKGDIDILVLAQFESNNLNLGTLFIIQDKKLVRLKDETNQTEEFPFTNHYIKEVPPAYFQTAYYDYTLGKWIFSMYKIDFKKQSVIRTNVEEYDLDEGNHYLKRYFQ